MVDQATLGGNGRNAPEAPGAALRHSATGFIHDLAVLAELQVKLFLHDVQQTAGRMVLPLMLLGIGLVASVCVLPIAMVGVAWFLADAGMQIGWAFIASAGIALLVAGLFLLIAYAMIRSRISPLDRSREEFARNLAWIKNVLKHSGRRGRGHL